MLKLYRCLGHDLKMCIFFVYNHQIIFVTLHRYFVFDYYSPALKKGGYIGFGLCVIPFVHPFVRLFVRHNFSFPLNILRNTL